MGVVRNPERLTVRRRPETASAVFPWFEPGASAPLFRRCPVPHPSRTRRSRRLFATTLTELNAIAALARIGDRSRPDAG